MSDKTNPKDLQGIKKAPLRLVPPSLIIAVADAMANGAERYGPFNFRETNVRATIYQEAAMRHLLAWADGEDISEDSGVSHLAHAVACLAIIIDAGEHGSLIDDRYPAGPAPKMLKERDKSANISK